MNSIKKSNPWVEHVKAYQTENKCTYAVALRESKASYKKPVTKKDDTEVVVQDPVPCPVPQTPKVRKRRLKKTSPESSQTADKATQTE